MKPMQRSARWGLFILTLVFIPFLIWQAGLEAAKPDWNGGIDSPHQTTVTPTPASLNYLPAIVRQLPYGLEKGLYLGVFFNPELDMTGALQRFEAQAGKRHSIYHYYTWWGFGDFSQHKFLLDQITGFGATPMLSFMSVPGAGLYGCEDATWNLDSINSGQHDAFLTKFAADIKDYPATFLFRWGHEMNLIQYSWAGWCNGGNLQASQKFIQAYQRIVNIFRAQGATNVKWIWSPSYVSFPADAWNDYHNYYPGDDYVDWIGIVGYNWGASRSDSNFEWDTFDALYRDFLVDAANRYPAIPVMLADYASVEDDGGDKAAWITEIFQRAPQHPNLKAAIWFNYNAPEYTPPPQFMIDSSPDALLAYQTAIQNPYFRSNPPYPPASYVPAVGRVTAWGDNGVGQAIPPVGLQDVIAIASNAFHNLARKSDGSVIAWGWNQDGQSTVPPGLKNVTAVAAGIAHSLALQANGTVVGWGANSHGQITMPPGLTGVTAIGAGGNHSVAVRADGTVAAWGNNDAFQLDVPPGLNGVTTLAGGEYHSLALKNNGTVVAWGWNREGVLDIPPGLNGVVAVAAGKTHSLALKSDGTVVAWGGNGSGQSTPPVGLTNVIAIAAGGNHSLALKSDGTVVAWGSNSKGQITVPANLSQARAIAAGEAHSVAVWDNTVHTK